MTTTHVLHLTARMSPLAPPLSEEDTGAWLWTHLRAAFPRALAVTLMPDHPHLIVAVEDPGAAEHRLARLLGQFGRSFGLRGQAARVAPAEVIRSSALARHVRYVALNPCRAGLTRCPLAWPWSTHRDVIGACAEPWITADRLASALGVSRRGFEARHHAYVSGDPHASVAGTPMPEAVLPTTRATVPLTTLHEAVAAATRTPLEAVRRAGLPRTLLVALAIDQGWRDTALLADLAGCTTRTIQRLVNEGDVAALRAARLCAGDPRLIQRARRRETPTSNNASSPTPRRSAA